MTRKHITLSVIAILLVAIVPALGIGVANWQRRRTKLTHAWCR